VDAKKIAARDQSTFLKQHNFLCLCVFCLCFVCAFMICLIKKQSSQDERPRARSKKQSPKPQVMRCPLDVHQERSRDIHHTQTHYTLSSFFLIDKGLFMFVQISRHVMISFTTNCSLTTTRTCVFYTHPPTPTSACASVSLSPPPLSHIDASFYLFIYLLTHTYLHTHTPLHTHPHTHTVTSTSTS
jgi:hypothetical protein